MAEDIDRYLKGQPVTAKLPTPAKKKPLHVTTSVDEPGTESGTPIGLLLVVGFLILVIVFGLVVLAVVYLRG